jgi:hypothetical protein
MPADQTWEQIAVIAARCAHAERTEHGVIATGNVGIGGIVLCLIGATRRRRSIGDQAISVDRISVSVVPLVDIGLPFASYVTVPAADPFCAF